MNALLFTAAGGADSTGSLVAFEGLGNGWWGKLQVHGADLAALSGPFEITMLLEIHDGTGTEPTKGFVYIEDDGGGGNLNIRFRAALDEVTVTVPVASVDTDLWYVIYFGWPAGGPTNNRFHLAVHAEDGTDLGNAVIGYNPGAGPTGAGSAQINIAQNSRGWGAKGFPGAVGGLAVYDEDPPGVASAASWSAPDPSDANIILCTRFAEGAGNTTTDEVANGFDYALTGHTWVVDAGAWGEEAAGGPTQITGTARRGGRASVDVVALVAAGGVARRGSRPAGAATDVGSGVAQISGVASRGGSSSGSARGIAAVGGLARGGGRAVAELIALGALSGKASGGTRAAANPTTIITGLSTASRGARASATVTDAGSAVVQISGVASRGGRGGGSARALARGAGVAGRGARSSAAAGAVAHAAGTALRGSRHTGTATDAGSVVVEISGVAARGGRGAAVARAVATIAGTSERGRRNTATAVDVGSGIIVVSGRARRGRGGSGTLRALGAVGGRVRTGSSSGGVASALVQAAGSATRGASSYAAVSPAAEAPQPLEIEITVRSAHHLETHVQPTHRAAVGVLPVT